MEIVLLSFSKDYESEICYFIEETQRLAKTLGKTIAAIDEIKGAKINQLIGNTDLVILPFNSEKLTDDNAASNAFVNNTSKELLKVYAGNQLGKSTRFCNSNAYYAETWWRELKEKVKNNFDFMRHYT